jgi:hypothetical protein
LCLWPQNPGDFLSTPLGLCGSKPQGGGANQTFTFIRALSAAAGPDFCNTHLEGKVVYSPGSAVHITLLPEPDDADASIGFIGFRPAPLFSSWQCLFFVCDFCFYMFLRVTDQRRDGSREMKKKKERGWGLYCNEFCFSNRVS